VLSRWAVGLAYICALAVVIALLFAGGVLP